MATLFIELEISEIKLSTYSSYEKYDDNPVKRGKVIIITGKPIYSSTYAFPEVIDFNSGGNRIKLPEIASVSITQETEKQQNIGELNYVGEYSNDELGIDEPTQFEAVVPYPSNEFNEAWNLIGNMHMGEVSVVCGIKAPETDTSGYTAIFDIEKSQSWPLSLFTLRRNGKRT